MVSETRVSIVVDTGNAENSLENLSNAFDELSATADDASDNLDNAGEAASDAGDAAAKAAKKSEKYQAAIEGMQKVTVAAGIALGGMTLLLTGAAKESIKFESAMADVKKVVNFDSPQGLQQMKQDLMDLSTQVPIAFDGLAQIAAAAGQSGIAANEIVKFTEAAAKMGTAFDISAEEAGQAMAEMRTAFKMSQTDVEALADQINYLGNNSPNTASKIMQIVQTVGPIGELAGVSAKQIAAMGASINSLSPDVVATGLKNMMLALTQGESATSAASKAFKSLGMDVVQVSKDMQTDSIGTINSIIEALKKLPEAQRTATINDIFGSEALPIVAQMVTNTDTLSKNLQAVGDASKYAGSMQAEFASKGGTTANQIELFNNNISLAKAALGDALFPAVNNLITAITPLIHGFGQWATENKTLLTTIIAVTGAVLGTITGLGSLALAFTAVSSGIAAVSAIAGGVAAAIGAISLPVVAVVVAVVAAIAALVAAGVLLYQNWDTVKAKATEIWNSVSDSVGNAVQSIADWFRSAGQSIQNEFSVIGNGVKSAMSAISSTVSSVWNGLKGIVSSAMSAVSSTVSSAWNGIKNAVSSAINAIKSVVSAGLSLLSSIFNAQFGIIKTVVSTVMNAIKALVQGDMQGVKNAFSSGFAAVVGIVKTAVSNIVSAFNNLGSQLFNIGVQAVQGLANGIKSRIASVGAEARNLASNVANSIRSVLDIHSPSRVTHALGEHAGQGLANGLKAKQSEVTKQAAQLSQQVIDNIASLKRDIALVGKDNNPLAALNYDIENGKYAGVSSSLLDNLKTATEAKQIATELYQANQNVSNSIADMNRQIALFGNDSPLSAFLYDMQNTDKYVGATAEKLQMMASKIKQLETLKQTKASEDAFSKLGADLAQESPMAKLTAEYEQRLAVVAQYEQLHTDKVAEAEAMRKQIKDSYTQASSSLMLSQYEGLFSGVAGITKAAFGEQSKAYRAMFAVQKAFSIAQSVMAIQTSVAKAMAVGFPANIPLIGQAISQGAGILSTLRGVQSPAIGQAHDGIMSVPKSGTWNLEKGERVLPKHTAAAMDKTLANTSGNNNVSVNVVVNADGSSDVQSDAQMGKHMGDAIKAAVLQTIIREKRQGGLLSAR